MQWRSPSTDEDIKQRFIFAIDNIFVIGLHLFDWLQPQINFGPNRTQLLPLLIILPTPNIATADRTKHRGPSIDDLPLQLIGSCFVGFD